jgi:hypothetical protein
MDRKRLTVKRLEIITSFGATIRQPLDDDFLDNGKTARRARRLMRIPMLSATSRMPSNNP